MFNLYMRVMSIDTHVDSYECTVISTGMAVDVGDATSIVDAINLTFIYDKINEADCFTARPTIVST